MGAYGYTDDPQYPSQHYNSECAHQPLIQRPPLVVPAHQERAGGGPRLVHVPGQHRPHALQEGISTGRR